MSGIRCVRLGRHTKGAGQGSSRTGLGSTARDNPDCGLLIHSLKGKARFMKGIVHTDICPVNKMIKLFIYIYRLKQTAAHRQTAVSEQTDSLTGSNSFRVSSYLLSPSTDSLILESQINLSPAKLAQVLQTTWIFHVRCKSVYENI